MIRIAECCASEAHDPSNREQLGGRITRQTKAHDSPKCERFGGRIHAPNKKFV